MKCTKIKEMFSGYLENTLDNTKSAAFEQHLDECVCCKVAYGHFNAAVMMLDEMPEVETPVGFHQGVMARVDQLRRTTPPLVRWWQIDWQQVLTIRVPARAAAVGFAALLLMVMAVQLTPVGTGVMNLIGIQKSTTGSVGTNPETTPAWPLAAVAPGYKMSGSGLLISVNAERRANGSVYALRFETRSQKAIRFEVSAGPESYSGSVVHNQGSVIRVPVTDELLTAMVNWRYGSSTYSEYIFLPLRFDAGASSKRLNMQFTKQSAGSVLSAIAEKYGIVIIAGGDLNKVVGFAQVESGSPDEALYYGIEETAANLHKQSLAQSVYIVEPADE